LTGPLDIAGLCSALFIPLTEPRFIARAHVRGADAIVLDLEDGVAARRKDAARAQLAIAVQQLASHGLPVLLRVNSNPSAMQEDLAASRAAGVRDVLLPKADVTAIERAAGLYPDVNWIAIVESPAAVMAAPAVAAASDRLRGLAFGSEDYCAALGLSSRDANLQLPAHLIALAARAAGLAAFGLPGTISEIKDMTAFERGVRAGRAMGFTGCFCVHPSQVAVVNRVFSPTAQEIEAAHRLLHAAQVADQQGRGAVALDGQMIDAPLVAQARAVLARSRRTAPEV
jgi:citrate lyase subunit beta/citryl-CoA lyase